MVVTNDGDAPLIIDRRPRSRPTPSTAATRTAADFAIVSQDCRADARSPRPARRGRRSDDAGRNEAKAAVAPAPAPSTSASSRRARTTRRSRVWSSSRTPTTRWTACCWPARARATRLGTVGGDVPSVLSLRSRRDRRQLRHVPAGRRAQLRDRGRRDRDHDHRRRRALGHRLEHDRPGPPGQRHVRAAAPAASARARNAANPNPAFAPLAETTGTPTNLLTTERPDQPERRHARLPPGDRRDRRPARRHVQQDAHVLAVHADSVKRQPSARVPPSGGAPACRFNALRRL